MRRRLQTCVALVALAAVAAAAQQSAGVWLRVAPEGEEFAVHMPGPNLSVRRELPFGKGVTLRPASFEVAHAGVLFSVLSFSKSEPGAPKSLDAFVRGFGHAVSTAGARADYLLPEGELKLDGRDGRRLVLRTDDGKGEARVFETGQHFYAVLTYGSAEAAAASKHFHDSFTFERDGADRVPLSETSQATGATAKSPQPLWPVAGGTSGTGAPAGGREQTAGAVEF